MGRWAPAPDENCYGVAVFEYNLHRDHPQCLLLELGERVYIYEECDGWYRGCSTSKQHIKGIFPKSFVKIKPSVREVVGNQITIIPIEDPITEEAKSVLREWHELWKDLFTETYKDSQLFNYKARIDLFCSIKGIMTDIIKCLSSSYLGVLGQNQLEEKKVKITQSIDNGNQLLSLDLVPRDEHGNKVNPVTCSDISPDQKGVLELYNIHKKVNIHRAHKGSDATRTNEPVHLFLGICQCVLLNQTPLEVYATLYNFDDNKMISERFLAPLTKNGLPEDRERLNDISTVFTDICRDDLVNLYIIIRYYRRGPVKLESSGNNNKAGGNTVEYLRPLGLSYISIKTHIDTVEANLGVRSDNNINRLDIYTLSKDKSENNFSELHRKVIMGEKAQFQQLDRTQGLYISNIKVFPGPLELVKQQNPHIFKKPSVAPGNMITRKLGFPAVINPTDQRNDLYITLREAKFSKGSKKAERNLLVQVSVRDAKGNEVKGAISRGTGEPTVDTYRSSVIYHCNSPLWDETLRINLPDHGSYSFANCHLLFTFRHANDKNKNKDKPGFAFLRLANKDGTLISNGNHKLIVYKDTARAAEFRHQVSDYLHLHSYFSMSQITKDTRISSDIEQKYNEFLEISSVFCSSKFTQNSDLKSLLQWEQHEARLGEILQRVQVIQGEELVKFLHMIFEALFMILDKKDQDFGEVVFDCIVFIICTLADHKFEHFRPVLDNYITTYFFHTQVYIKLLDRLKIKVEQFQTKNIGDIMKALEYLFKFIVQSSHLHSQASTIDRSFSKFTRSLLEFFDKLNNMIKVHPNRLTTAKTLKYFPHTIPELNKILPLQTTCQIISNFIDAVPSTDEKEIIRYKLSCVYDIVKGQILEDPVGCELLIPLLMRHLKFHLKDEETIRDKEEVRKEKTQAVEILTHILITVSNKHSNTGIVRGIVDPLLELLFRLVCQVDKVKDIDLSRDYVSCLIALLHLMNDEHYTSYMEPMNEKDLIDFLNEVFLVFKDLVKSNVYPPRWIVMSMLQSYVVLNSIIFFSKALSKIPPQANGPQDYMGKKKQLWENFFYLCVGFITQESLQLEEFRETKRQKIAGQYGDMRSEMGQEMVRMLNKLGDNKKIFIPDIVGPFLEVTLVPLESLRKEVIPIFFDMVECYHRDRGNFEIVEREVIDKLDVLISGGKGDTNYSLLMYETLLRKFNSPDINRSLHQNGVRFVNSVKLLLEHLLNFREVREGDHHSEARMLCIVNLLNFYEELNRHEMYLRYIWKLYTSHISQKNFVEAAYTLEMYASKLQFSDITFVEKFETLPRERVRERKGRLHNIIIKHFEEGKSFENSFRFYKDLCDYYEGIFDYKQLSEGLQRQAQGYMKILNTVRYPNDYFFVGFYGQGFPAFLRNKRFIYCAKELARLSFVQIRFQEQFPKASLLNYTSDPIAEVKDSPETFLQIYKVTCLMEEREEFLGRDVPSLISQFWDTNDIACFCYDKRFNKAGGKIKDDDFANTWLEKTKFITVEPLPNKLRLVEIARQEVTELSPINTAIEAMEKKNRELRILIDGYKAQRETNANPLTMALNGTIDAVVQGGIKKYEEAFFCKEYGEKNPADAENIMYLKRIIIDQVEILQDGIDVHGKVCAESVKPLHDHLTSQHDKLRQDSNKYRRELGMSSGTPYRSMRTSTIASNSTLHRYNSTLSRNMRSRTSMISVTSGEESPFVTGGATPPPLPSRKTEVLPDPQALIRDRRSAANANAPDTPALPPKKRSSLIHSSPSLKRESQKSINSNGSLDMSFSNTSIENDHEVNNNVPTLPPRPKISCSTTPPDNSNNVLTDEAVDMPPPLPQRTNSSAARPPKVPRDKTVPLPIPPAQ
ncbi:dedicator of cytokinesis protein 3-like isoform X4 [Bolinopsis microptera]|uniref:dedicator of cytokinesis protein 3-like isoform X4 n=1 Tax=Bolinopsis microptera TaxID=2820187 RepID=UPI003078C08E